MRTLVHLSDLHFGRLHAPTLEPLRAAVHALRPDLVVVSGDLTQRARTEEFVEARAFLDALPSPQIVVPGNHDVPLYNPISRFVFGLARYQRFITHDLQPSYVDDEIAVLGLNTARSLTGAGGRISHWQIGLIRERMCPLGGRVKILVTHHPFDLPDDSHHKAIVGRAELAMEAVAGCGVDAILSGHLHVIHTGHSSERFAIRGHSALLIQAGTATSSRERGEANSFNVIRIDGRRITVQRRIWEPDTHEFYTAATDQYEKSEDGWRAAA